MSIPAEVRIRMRIAWYSLRLIARRLDWTAFMGAWPAAALPRSLICGWAFAVQGTADRWSL